MKQNRMLFGLAIGLLAFSMSSCVDSTFLDETQTTDLTKERVFGDSALTAGFLNSVYSNIGFDILPNRFGPGGLQTACDEAEFKITSDVKTDQMFATGTVNAISVTDDAWRTCYTQIRAVNVFLQNVDACPMTASAKVLYKAEARFLRAWYYFILVRHYGGVPLLGDIIYDNENFEDMNMTRSSFGDCIDYIVSECEAAANDLPNRRNGVAFGRASAGSCMGLISRALIYAASDFFNGTTFTSDPKLQSLVGYAEHEESRWKDAADAAARLIATGAWQIYDRHENSDGESVPGWGRTAIFEASDYVTQNTYNGKKYTSGAYCCHIFTLHRGSSLDKEGWFGPPSCVGNGEGGYPNFDLVESFPMADGSPVGSGKYTYDRMNPGENRDPRFKLWFNWNGSKQFAPGFAEKDIYTYQGVGATVDAIYQGTRTGLYFRKGTYFSPYLIGVPQTYCLIRYEEILLNWAEAVNEYYGPQHSEQLGSLLLSPVEVLKMIREGAGIEPGDNGMYGLKENMSYDEMRDAIRLERRLELMLEGHRFFDVRRWGIAEQTENCMIHGWEITRKLDGSETGRMINVRQHVFRTAMYFWPIPYSEVNRSEDLLQNPYYE